LQREEGLLISEYTNLMTAIENLYLIVTKQKKTNEHFAEIVKRLLKDTNFILNLSEEEIENVANKIKNIRRYLVHSNKTQKSTANDIAFMTHIIAILIEVIRSRIMMEIGIDQEKIERYYKKVEGLENVKKYLVSGIEKEIIKEEKKMSIEPLSEEEKEDIAKLNALSGTRYRESDYNLENSKDLIEAIENLTAEYMDYLHYWLNLEETMENITEVEYENQVQNDTMNFAKEIMMYAKESKKGR